MAPLHRVLAGRLKLRHFHLFRQICELQTLRRAAEACHMTQPAATKLVQEFEEMLGVALFLRDRRGMKLTQHGAVVRRHVDVLLADIGNLRAELDLFSEGASGRIRLGIIPSLSSALLSGAIAEMLASQPDVRFEMQEGATDALLAALTRNDLDLAFGRVLDFQQSDALRVIPVYTETFAIACRSRHVLTGRPRATWPELAQEAWALPAPGTPLRELADSLFSSHGVLRPKVAVASSSFHQLRHLLAASDLVGVLPRSIAMQAQAAGDLALLQPKLGADFAPISLISRRELEQPPVVQTFVRTVLRTAAALRLR
jgi:DNA-binding transcriptional LysR family regulator